MSEEKLGKWWSSSANVTELSLSIKGILMGLVPLLVAISATVRADVSMAEWDTAINGVEAFIVLAGGGISAGAFLYGVLRKIVLKFRK